MPIINCDVKLVGRFHCDTPESAGPALRKRHQLGALYDTSASHCLVTMQFGTSGTFLERDDVNFYKGHVPDAPPMLGPEQSKAYRCAQLEATSGSPRHAAAMFAALAVGAVVGMVVGTLAVGAVAAVHALNPAFLFAVTSAQWGLITSICIVACAAGKVAWDFVAYKAACLAFSRLHTLSEHASKVVAEAPCSAKDLAKMEADANVAMLSDSWALRHGGLELHAIIHDGSTKDEKKGLFGSGLFAAQA